MAMQKLGSVMRRSQLHAGIIEAYIEGQAISIVQFIKSLNELKRLLDDAEQLLRSETVD